MDQWDGELTEIKQRRVQTGGSKRGELKAHPTGLISHAMRPQKKHIRVLFTNKSPQILTILDIAR